MLWVGDNPGNLWQMTWESGKNQGIRFIYWDYYSCKDSAFGLQRECGRTHRCHYHPLCCTRGQQRHGYPAHRVGCQRLRPQRSRLHTALSVRSEWTPAMLALDSPKALQWYEQSLLNFNYEVKTQHALLKPSLHLSLLMATQTWMSNATTVRRRWFWPRSADGFTAFGSFWTRARMPITPQSIRRPWRFI